jgi:hypothetical protein
VRVRPRFHSYPLALTIGQVQKKPGLTRPKNMDILTAGQGEFESDLPMKTKTHFSFRIDIWDNDGGSIFERCRC